VLEEPLQAALAKKLLKGDFSMKRPALTGAVLASTAMLATALPLFAADTLTWPWNDKTPPDPALSVLTSVESVKAGINKVKPPTIAISIEASAPTPGFSEFQLVPRMGDPNDLIFAFDAKGRPSQDPTQQVVTPVTISVEYSEAPVDKVGVVEVYSQSNCKAFSLTYNKEVDCTSTSVPQ
jgi:hypothetical protein